MMKYLQAVISLQELLNPSFKVGAHTGQKTETIRPLGWENWRKKMEDSSFKVWRTGERRWRIHPSRFGELDKDEVRNVLLVWRIWDRWWTEPTNPSYWFGLVKWGEPDKLSAFKWYIMCLVQRAQRLNFTKYLGLILLSKYIYIYIVYILDIHKV